MSKILLQGTDSKLKLQNGSFLLLQENTSRRKLSLANLDEINASHLYPVTMVKLDFDTPVYVHSAIGTVTYNGNEYLGVGMYGSVSQTRDSENLGPTSITLSLSGVKADYIAEAKDSGNLYDKVTIYQGYLQDDGTLVDTPFVVWSGWFDYASIRVEEESAVFITCQHDLSSLEEKSGRRFSDEDQQNAYTGDVGLEFAGEMSDIKLLWGGGPVSTRSFDWNGEGNIP